MLFDVVFLGFPIALALCLGAHAIRESDSRFWRPAFCFLAYSVYYLVGGREILLYLTVALLIGGGWVSVDGVGSAV
jgi:hypothetical protein